MIICEIALKTLNAEVERIEQAFDKPGNSSTQLAEFKGMMRALYWVRDGDKYNLPEKFRALP